MSRNIHIVHLYPNEMNTYGDRGNILTLQKRMEWYGLSPVVHYHHPGKPFPEHVDLVFGGGGQDSAQSDIQRDIHVIGGRLRGLAEEGVPMLMICGMYQLLGHAFITHQNERIEGIGIIDMVTQATKRRLIGNLAVDTEDFGRLYGFENHSGQTKLSPGQLPLGKVIRGNGNNDHDKLEGARIHKIIATYMHGPVLPLNPQLTDWLLETAADHAGVQVEPTIIDDSYVTLARKAATKRSY